MTTPNRRVLIELAGGQWVDAERETLRARPSLRRGPDLGAVLRVDGNPLAAEDAVTLAPRRLERLLERLEPAHRDDPLRILSILSILSWSGTLAEGLFEAHPRTWMSPGPALLDRFCAAVAPTLRSRNWTLCFQPHARHVLSDVKGCRQFLAQHVDEPFGVALSPATMLEMSMLPRIEEHLERLFEGLGPSAQMVILEDVLAVPDGDGLPTRVPFGQGVMPADVVRNLLGEHVPLERPVLQPPGVEPPGAGTHGT